MDTPMYELIFAVIFVNTSSVDVVTILFCIFILQRWLLSTVDTIDMVYAYNFMLLND